MQMNCVITAMLSAEPWLYDVWFVGWNAVSRRPSKPVPNSISGTEHEPKSPMDEADAVADAAALDTTELTLVATATWPEAVAAEADAVTVSVNDAVTVTVTVAVAVAHTSLPDDPLELPLDDPLEPLFDDPLEPLFDELLAADVALAAPVAAAVEAATLWVTPWSLTSGTAAKSVLIPNTALNASACPPVLAVTVSAAALAEAQVACAVASAPQLFTSWSHMNCVMMSMLSADP